MDSATIVVLSALVIGLIYGVVGLLSGFCMMSSLRGWWADGDGRLVRTYALAMGIGIAASQGLASERRALGANADASRGSPPATSHPTTWF